MPPKRTQLPAPSAPAGGPSLPALREAVERVKSTNDPNEANAARAWAATYVRSVLQERDPSKVGEALYAAAELQAWACRRLGEMFPSRQGQGGGPKGDIVSEGEEVPEPPVTHAAICRYRKLAAIPEAKYSAAIAELRGQQQPPTQTALLAYAPAVPKPPRQLLVEKTAARLMQRAINGLSDRAGELRELRDRAPDFHRKDLSARIEQVLAARAVLDGKPPEVKVEETARAVLETAAKALEDATEAMRRVFEASSAKDADTVEGFLVDLEDKASELRTTANGLAALGLDTSDRRAVDARAQEELRRTGEGQRGAK